MTTTSTAKPATTHAEFVPDEIVERFCLVGPPALHVARLRELADIGVEHFGLYLQHDAQDATLSAYGERVLPALSDPLHALGLSRTGRRPVPASRRTAARRCSSHPARSRPTERAPAGRILRLVGDGGAPAGRPHRRRRH